MTLVEHRPISSRIGIVRAKRRLDPGYGMATALTCCVAGARSSTFGHITMEFPAPKPADFEILETGDLWDATARPPQPSVDEVTKSAVNAAAARRGCWKGYTGERLLDAEKGSGCSSREQEEVAR
ncbi:hypothetical protein H105_03586 [Trichophyton soudanense CBS 452.61]|uniref:Uncharacterized protein n=1 Tax=Trichophyton soudanense CBS 452.61 TaxID=1215331 RepID=A0A022XWM7_TRISD|nr:hypothetical protein H105_03586 [Trichophyton soudanense CBS 452.61]